MTLHPSPIESAPGLGSLLLLALVQGVTEFLPVSSDGHLVLVQTWMRHLQPGPGPGVGGANLAIDVALHLGTLCAVLLVYRRDLLAILRRLLVGDAREIGLLLLGTIPAALVGLCFRELFEQLFESGVAAALGLFVTAGFLFVGERARRRQGATANTHVLDWRDALWIGCFQALAPLPGVSRSGTTMATALVRGVSAEQAARFSFLLSIPAVGGAVLLEVPDLVRAGGFSAELALAVAATFVVGVSALRFLLSFLGRGAFRWCAYYCMALGTAALVLL